MPPCPLCGRPLAVLGQTGRLAWLGCRACGAVVYGEDVTPAPPRKGPTPTGRPRKVATGRPRKAKSKG